MKTLQKIDAPVWDDLIFNDRNKLYGAYELRKKNNSHLITGLVFTLFSLGIVFFTIKQFEQKHEITFKTEQKHELVKVIEQEFVFEMGKKPTEPTNQSSGAKPTSGAVNSSNYLVTNSVDNSEKKSDTTSTANTNYSNGSNSNLQSNGNGNAIDSTSLFTSGNSSNSSNNSWVDVPEVFPEFPGGETKMFEFLSRTLRFPRHHNLAGNRSVTVYMSFVVNKNGEIEDIKIERSGGREFDEEAIKAVNKMPKWKPGSMGKVPVSVRFRLPIRFTLRE